MSQPMPYRSGSRPRRTSIDRPGTRWGARAWGAAAVGLLAGLPLASHAEPVFREWRAEFATVNQDSYGTGPSTARVTPIPLVIDTGRQNIKVGDVADVTVPGWWIFPSTYLGKYGAELNGHFDLRTGLEITTRQDPGTISANQILNAFLNFDDHRRAGELVAFNTRTQSETQSLKSTFPNVGLDIDFVFALDTELRSRVCVVECIAGTVIPRIHTDPDLRLPIFDYNRDKDGDGAPDGGIELFGLSIPEVPGDPVAGGSSTDNPSLTIPLGSPVKVGPFRDLSVGSVTIQVPQPHVSGAESFGDSKLVAAAQDDFIDIAIDIDNMVSLAITQGRSSQLFGAALTIPGVDIGGGYELINLNVNLGIDYRQEFTLMSNLAVDLAFSEPVIWYDADGELQVTSQWSGLWNDFPSFTLPRAGTVTVTPTFDLEATLRNLTQLDFDLGIIFELFKIWFDSGIFGNGELHLVDVDPSFDVGRAPVFDKKFVLEGWNNFAGAPFDVHFVESLLPTDGSTCLELPAEEQAACLQEFVSDTTACPALASINYQRLLDDLIALRKVRYLAYSNNPLYPKPVNANPDLVTPLDAPILNLTAQLARCNLPVATTTVVRDFTVPPSETVTVFEDPPFLVGGFMPGRSALIPEPATLALAALACLLLAWRGRHHRARRHP